MATRAELRTRAREKADQDNSTFPTDAQYNSWLNEAGGAVWRRLVGAGWRPIRTAVSLTANGAASYTIGTDVHSVLDVSRTTPSQNIRYPLERVNPEELQPLEPLTGEAVKYELLN